MNTITTTRTAIRIRGAVQGVGFRPFVYRLATELGLNGWVTNDTSGVNIEVEGPGERVERFAELLNARKPSLAAIHSMDQKILKPVGYKKFEIRESSSVEDKTALVLPDIATCDDCLDEINSPTERRFNYPFTNCTNCGPRYTIIEGLPYDRKTTAMKNFGMCSSCGKEYKQPSDRRFHAQPIACPKCGPKVFLTDAKGKVFSRESKSVEESAERIREGRIVALKGLGGFLLVCDARNTDAVKRLRQKKYREEKPLAVMYPDIKSVKEDCEVNQLEEETMLSPRHPIVLLKRKENFSLAKNVAPNNPYLGVMLPYTPLHHILMKILGFPIVATSGNKTDDPIAIDNEEALKRLGGIADFFLLHDRPILRRVDDSVVRVMENRLSILRRARGYAPLPIVIDKQSKKNILALGGHLKNTISFSKGNNIFVSQHIGDLETREAIGSFREVIDSLGRLYDFSPHAVAVDMHPNYESTKFGEELASRKGVDVVRVQHHHAHVASCMCENRIDDTVMGVAWDGTGYGTDGQAWGSEFLIADYKGFERFAHFIPFQLPGGEAAIRKVSHSALGALYTTFGDDIFSEKFNSIPALKAFNDKEIRLLTDCMKTKLNSPMVYGMGRLFDAVSSILGVRQSCSFEGQAAMQLEFEGMGVKTKGVYRYKIGSKKPAVVDWRPMVSDIVHDYILGTDRSVISYKFHQTLARIIFDVADLSGIRKVVLSGGVFQNALLNSLVRKEFEGKKFRIYEHSDIPTNDGGISVGQVAVAIEQSR